MTECGVQRRYTEDQEEHVTECGVQRRYIEDQEEHVTEWGCRDVTQRTGRNT